MDHEQNWDASVANQIALARFAWIFGTGVAIALTFPQILFAATISTILGFCAGIMATAALFVRESVWNPHLTRWDVAAGLYAMSLFTGFFVDIESIQAYIHAQQTLG